MHAHYYKHLLNRFAGGHGYLKLKYQIKNGITPVANHGVMPFSLLIWEFFGTRSDRFFLGEFFRTQKAVGLNQEESDTGRKAVLEMDKANIDYILNIFRTLSTEQPEQLLYRENGDSIELRTLESNGNCLSLGMQNNGWKLIGSKSAEAA